MTEVGSALGAIRPGARLWTGIVSSLNPFKVDGVPVAPPGTFAPLLGDHVLCVSEGNASWCLHVSRGYALPAQVTVMGVGAGVVTAADSTGRSYTLQAAGSYSVGNVVAVDWTTSQGRVSGRATAQTGTPPPATGGPSVITRTQAFRAIEAGTWTTYWDRSRVQQHRLSTSSPIGYGAWFYGGVIQQVVGSGTVQSARIFLPRIRGVGAATAHLYRHTHDSMPTGDVLRVGGASDVPTVSGQGWYSLPTSLAQALATNGGGLALLGSPFLAFAGLETFTSDSAAVDGPMSGAVEITWL